MTSPVPTLLPEAQAAPRGFQTRGPNMLGPAVSSAPVRDGDLSPSEKLCPTPSVCPWTTARCIRNLTAESDKKDTLNQTTKKIPLQEK